MMALSMALVLPAVRCDQPGPAPSPPPTASPTAEPTPSPKPTPCVPPVTDDWEIQPGTGTLRPNVNVAIASVTGCEINSNCPLPVSMGVFFDSVIAKLLEDGMCAGLAKPGEDQIIVGRTRCGWYEAYHVFNTGGNKVSWAGGGYRDDWRPQICDEPSAPPSSIPTPIPAPTPTPENPPASPGAPLPPGTCPLGLGFGKVELHKNNSFANPDGSRVFVVDVTSKVCDRAYCDSVGNPNQCCSPGGGDGGDAVCEAQLYGVAGDGVAGPEFLVTGTPRATERRDLTKFKITTDPGSGPVTVVACVPSHPALCSPAISIPW
jgi:hypothetical protein